MKIYAAQVNPCVGDIAGNAAMVIKHVKAAVRSGAELVVFPELCVTGYPPEDLLLRQTFIEEEQAALARIAAAGKSIPVIVGATYSDTKGKLYNAAWLLKHGQAEVISVKTDLPNYGVFDEKRYFASGEVLKTFTIEGRRLGVLVCEDTWTASKTAAYKKKKVDVLISINASPFSTTKRGERLEIAAKRAQEAEAELYYINTVGGQDGVVFDGGSFALDKSGKLTAMLPQFVETCEVFTGKAKLIEEVEEKYQAMVLALRDYVGKNGFRKVLLGLSGGIDSALTALVAVDALGVENVRLMVLPTRFTSKETYKDAYAMCKNLRIEPELIDIEPAFKAFEKMLAKNFKGLESGLAEENMQSRIRGLILMAISNKHDELLVTTGNKSELATGYATLYGDMCGAFNVLKDLYKTGVYEVAAWRNGDGVIPKNIFSKAPTAELRHNQKDQDLLPPYEELDAILKLLIEGRKSIKDIVKKGFKAATVENVAGMLYRSEYKRFQSAPGAKLTSTAFGKDWRYPLTNKFRK